MAVTLHVSADHTADLRPGDPGYDPFLDLWGRLSRPFDVTATVSALVGLSVKDTERLVGLALATCDEAEALLDHFPRTIRSLATSMQTQAERCVGEIRGPVLWSETISARAASFGNPDVYICATPSRAYDIEENQALVWALLRIRDAAETALADQVLRTEEDRVARHARRNGNDAGRYAEHPSLAGVTRRLPGPRAMRKIRTGKKKRAYAPAMAMLDRLANPLDPDDVDELCDERTRAQHRVLMRIVHLLEDRTSNRLPEARVERGSLYMGPVQFHHGRFGDEHDRPSGIVVGPLLVDLPEEGPDSPDGPSRTEAEAALAARAGRRPSMVVMGDDDIVRAVDRAVELVRG
jgi:hypothetical protein